MVAVTAAPATVKITDAALQVLPHAVTVHVAPLRLTAMAVTAILTTIMAIHRVDDRAPQVTAAVTEAVTVAAVAGLGPPTTGAEAVVAVVGAALARMSAAVAAGTEVLAGHRRRGPTAVGA